MSEIQTSPAPAASAEVSAGAVESPEPSGTTMESTPETSPEVSTETPVEVAASPEVEERPPEPEFDPESWDGNIESLPDTLRGPVDFLHRRLESGYTKKFQSLADERKELEQLRAAAAAPVDTTPAEEREAMQRELNLLRSLLEGAEDPRIAEYEAKNGTLSAELDKLTAEFGDYRSLVEADINEQAAKYAKDFRSKNAAIFDSEEKRSQLSGLLNNGWDPDLAVKLIGQNEKVVGFANSLKEQGVPPDVAIEHSLMKLGATQRRPRPGARLTAGAESRNNPASTKQTVNNAGSSNEARLLAARAAVNWRTKNKVG